MEEQYITSRKMEQMIAEICQERGIACTALSNGWVHLLKRDGKRGEVNGYTFSLNSAGATAIANDKVATSQVLQYAGISHIPHSLLRVGPDGLTHYYGDNAYVGDIVVKPVQGAGGHNVRRFPSNIEAETWIRTMDEPAWAVSPFVLADYEARYIMLDGELLLCYKKIGVEIDGLTMFNLGLGAQPTEYRPTDEEIQLAHDAMTAVHLRSGMVDIVATPEGERLVMEVNASCVMESYSRVSPEHELRARAVYARMIEAMFAE